MRNNKFVNALALVGALIILLGVSSAANEAFAATPETNLNSEVSTAISRL
jgi:hypothetical protein